MESVLLDLAFILFLIAFGVLGFFKGIKKGAIDLGLALVAMFISLTSILNPIKLIFIKILNLENKIVGNDFIFNLTYSSLFNLIGGILTFLLVYLIFKLTFYLVAKTFYYKSTKNKLDKGLGIVLTSFVYIFSWFYLVSILSVSTLGKREIVENSRINNVYLNINNSIYLSEKGKEKHRAEKAIIKITSGNILIKTNEEELDKYQKVYQKILLIRKNPETYFNNFNSVDVSKKQIMFNETIDLIIGITDFALYNKDQVSNMNFIIDDLLDEMLSYFPDGYSLSISETRQEKLLSNIEKLEINKNIKKNIYEKIKYVEL